MRHVVVHVHALDALAVHLSVKLVALAGLARKALLGVRHIQSAVTGAFEGSEHSVASGGADDPYVKHALEWLALSLLVIEETPG